jgi:hypothetical protein
MRVLVAISGPHGTYKFRADISGETLAEVGRRVLREGATEPAGPDGRAARWWAPHTVAYVSPYEEPR